MISKPQRILRFSFLLILLTAMGCGNNPRTYRVDGTIEFEDGSPVMFGNIEFLNQEHAVNARGKINRDGTFSLSTYRPNDGAVAGLHKVTVQQFTTIPLTANQDIKIEHDHGLMVADSYRSYDRTELEVTIEKQVNQIKLVVRAQEE